MQNRDRYVRLIRLCLPYVPDPNEQKVLEEIRKTYDYYHHMDQQANHAELIRDWLVDKFAIADTVDQCRAQIKRIKKTGHPADRHHSLQPAGREPRRNHSRLC